MNTTTPIRLAAERIRNRRLELVLSEREVAARWGVSTAIIRSIEAGTVNADLTLGQLANLATILGLDITDLLDTACLEPKARVAPTVPDDDVTDVEKVGSLLADIRVLIPIEGIATALKWDIDRVMTALEELDEKVWGAGLRVHRLHHDVRLARRVSVSTTDELAAVWRRLFAVRSLAPVHARLLRDIRDERVTLRGNKDIEKVRLPELANAGLISPTPASSGTTARWQLTDDVRFSLLLDED